MFISCKEFHKMKIFKFISFIFLSLVSNFLFSQIGAQSFKVLPADNEMVRLSLYILNEIKNDNLQKIEDKYSVGYTDSLNKEEVKQCISFNEVRDTSMIEYYEDNNSETEITFKFVCDAEEVINLLCMSDGKDGSTANFKIVFEQGVKPSTIKKVNELIIPSK